MISIDKTALLPKFADLFYFNLFYIVLNGFNFFYIVLNAKILISKFYYYKFELWI